MVRIEGPVVRRLQRTFVEDWHTASEEALSDATYFPERSIGGDQVAVGGDGIAVGGDGIAVGGDGIAVGGDGIAVGGDGIAVGSDGIAVGSDQVAVGSDAIAVGGDQTVAVVEGGPDIEHNALHWMFLQLLMSARHSIRISSPYLIPHVSLLAALQVAAARGVDVRIQTNGPAAENTLLYWAKRSFYRSLLGSNVHIAETVGDYNHSKIIIVDDRYTFVGSPNLDVRSDELNFEIGVVMLGPDICRQATELFEARIESGRTIDLDSVRTDWRARLMYGLGRLISPVL
jgi:phosphatidylserine/phosphatidylglycerophosphate/cardiolipin synthase-like enzyme